MSKSKVKDSVSLSKPTKTEQSLFEEDDDFEEFPAEDWDEREEDGTDKQLWEDNWDDDNVEDDFSCQLRAELERLGQKVSQPEPMKT
uniref:26S proteasome complex subunit SEM1 n=1 Tax=Halichondria panicea TaxID=6063 RepID=A0A6B9CYK6_HALPA|nr:26S proteasome complex subunit SEM1-like protein [Halichondria panicea]